MSLDNPTPSRPFMFAKIRPRLIPELKPRLPAEMTPARSVRNLWRISRRDRAVRRGVTRPTGRLNYDAVSS